MTILRTMRIRLFRPVAVVLLSTALGSAWAQPSAGGETDPLEALLQERGLVGQMSQLGQSMGAAASSLVIHAMGFLGVPYRLGGNSAESGFDCSGFVRAVYAQTAGLVLPRRAEQQAAATQTIPKAELKPGDLVFFNTLQRGFSHVGIYIGDGRFIHSPKPGAHVRMEDMRVAYWRSRFDGARRVTDAAEATGPGSVDP